MRLKIQVKPFFLFNVSEEQSVVLNYREKYNQIDLLLQTNPGILDTFHADLKDYGSEDGRDLALFIGADTTDAYRKCY
jgi:hypothetical protein